MTRLGVATGVLLAGAFFLAGCGGAGGWVVRPAPVDDRLVESVVDRQTGLFDSARIAVIDVDGILMNQREAGLFGSQENPVSLFIEKIDQARKDHRVKALVLRINSPGGGVTASDIMYRRLVRFRKERNVPVVAIIEDIGASGGYYLACGADTILAHPTSVTGSIGVIVQTVSVAGTMKLLGITAQAVTSGKYKDMASPFKPLDTDDLAVLRGIVDTFYERFLGVVGSSRTKIPKDKLRALADGRVYTGPQAQKEGLVDGLGYLEDAIALAKKQAGVPRADVVIYHRPLGYKANVYSRAPAGSPQVNLLNVNLPDVLPSTRPRFLYLWTGKGGA